MRSWVNADLPNTGSTGLKSPSKSSIGRAQRPQSSLQLISAFLGKRPHIIHKGYVEVVRKEERWCRSARRGKGRVKDGQRPKGGGRGWGARSRVRAEAGRILSQERRAEYCVFIVTKLHPNTRLVSGPSQWHALIICYSLPD